MDYEIARTYIFRTPSKHKEHYSVRRNLSSGGLSSLIFALSANAFVWLVYFIDEFRNIVVTLQLLLLLLLLLLLILSIIFQKRRAIKISEKKIKQKKHDVATEKAKGRVGGAVGAAVAVIITSQLSLGVSPMIILILSPMITVFFFFTATIFYYKLYLLKKYCPDLAGETDYDKHLKYLK